MPLWKHGDSSPDILRKILQTLTDGPRQGGFAKVVVDNTAVSTAAYSANDIVGGLRTLALGRVNGAGVVLQSLEVVDLSDQKAELSLIFFKANPTASTTADQGALTIHANDIAKVLGIVDIVADDYTDLGSYSIATKTGIGLVLQPTSGTDIYCVVVTPGTPDYVAATDLSIAFGVLQD